MKQQVKDLSFGNALKKITSQDTSERPSEADKSPTQRKLKS